MDQPFLNVKICIHVTCLLICGALLLTIFSCKPIKRAAYFQDIPDSISADPFYLHLAAYKDLIIRQDDILQISIQTIDSPVSFANHSAPFPATIPNSGASPQVQSTTGFAVDKMGEIEIPVLGRIHVGGLSLPMIRDSLRLRSARYYQDPVISVRLANFSVSIIGEVAKPGNYIMPHEKVSVLDALGIAGDITVYGKRENVLLLRNSDNHKDGVRLDLNSSLSLRSPYFFLQQGDVIYVEPNKSRITASTDGTRTRNYALIASGLSVLIILISRITF